MRLVITYESDKGRRHYTVIRKYSANMFGIPLTVDSIAYQEQDSTVSACASTAIWTAFQGTGMLFQHQIPSPVEITKAATLHTPFSNRHFPNKGLSMEQMAHAIRNVGLEPFAVDVKPKSDKDLLSYATVKGTVYSFLKARIPIIFGFALKDVSPIPISRFDGRNARHAVTITGYSLKPASTPEKWDDTEFYLRSSRIDEVYVHDDGIGPYARMQFDNKRFTSLTLSSLTCSWYNLERKTGFVRAIPDKLLVALNHKIRIPFSTILLIVSKINRIFRTGFSKGLPKIEWDIHLIEVSDFKNDILERLPVTNTHRLEVLSEPLPKYIWRAKAQEDDDNPLFDLLFDATDIEQALLLKRFVIYNEAKCEFLQQWVKSRPQVDPIPSVEKFVDEFSKIDFTHAVVA